MLWLHSTKASKMKPLFWVSTTDIYRFCWCSYIIDIIHKEVLPSCFSHLAIHKIPMSFPCCSHPPRQLFRSRPCMPRGAFQRQQRQLLHHLQWSLGQKSGGNLGNRLWFFVATKFVIIHCFLLIPFFLYKSKIIQWSRPKVFKPINSCCFKDPESYADQLRVVFGLKTCWKGTFTCWKSYTWGGKTPNSVFCIFPPKPIQVHWHCVFCFSLMAPLPKRSCLHWIIGPDLWGWGVKRFAIAPCTKEWQQWMRAKTTASQRTLALALNTTCPAQYRSLVLVGLKEGPTWLPDWGGGSTTNHERLLEPRSYCKFMICTSLIRGHDFLKINLRLGFKPPTAQCLPDFCHWIYTHVHTSRSTYNTIESTI